MHFTYAAPNLEHLQQGDVLQKTPELLELIREIHPHYANDSYKYFQVLTQSCDLVRRGGKPCKSRYITLAAVRSLDLVVERAIANFSDKVEFKGEILCSEKFKPKLSDVLNKLFNNNDTNHFFLNAEPEVGLLEDYCTQLHLSISIRAYEHYDVCLKAKVVELQENFRAKLGWLVGNLYSRVGTEDYVPGAMADDAQYKKFLDERMDEFVGWIPDANFQAFKKHVNKGQSIEEVLGFVQEDRASAKARRLDQLTRNMAKALDLDDSKIETLRNFLNLNPVISKALEK
ncbi:hypothetical protein ACCD08_06065 [Telluria sp. Tellsp104]